MLKFLIFIFVCFSLISPQSFSAQLSASATSENELEARAESLRRLAESIQVSVSGEAIVFTQFKDNEATQELVDSVKTSTNLTLLGVEVFVKKTKLGFRAEAQIDTEKSFNLYLTKIKAEKQILDNQIIYFRQQKTDLDKLVTAYELTPMLSSHIEDFLIATMLSVKSQKGETKKIPEWMADLSNKSQTLLSVKDFIKQLASSAITDSKVAALMLVNSITQKSVFTCPIFKKNGAWLAYNDPLNVEIRKLLTSPAQSKDKAQYFLIGHSDNNANPATSISYQLYDSSGEPLQKNQVNYLLSQPTWQTQPIQKNAVLTSINYEFKDTAGKLIPENITTEKQLYTLVKQNILNNQSMVATDPCRPIEQFSNIALANAYGASSFLSMKIAGNLSTFVLRPDPKEHQFALAKVTFQQSDLTGQKVMSNRSAVGKKFPVLDANNALISAVEIAFKKLPN